MFIQDDDAERTVLLLLHGGLPEFFLTEVISAKFAGVVFRDELLGERCGHAAC
jgi:hypothetical protein